jgi:hypothetical protein
MPLQATSGAASYDAFGGGVAAVPQYIEDVFSTYLYTGNGSTQTITNGIDLAGDGGLVWIKSRQFAYNHSLTDTARGVNQGLASNTTSAQVDYSGSGGSVTAFNSTGFSLGSRTEVNDTGTNASWTFRKQPKFFDVVTYTGTGLDRTIAHNLGSVPGCVIVKCTSSGGSATYNWVVGHRSLASNEYLQLNTTDQVFSGGSVFNTNTVPNTSTTFSVGTNAITNQSGQTYVAYLFAHDAGGFGLTGTDNVISCGSYTGNGSATGPVITLGYEPQWLMIKKSSSTGNWQMIDNMRGMPVNSADATLQANLTNAETSVEYVSPTSTGFQITSTNTEVNTNASTYIYIAIRRGPMKVPTGGTTVFQPVAYTGTNVDNRLVDTGIVTDMTMARIRTATSTGGFYTADRLRADASLGTAITSAENTDSDSFMTPTVGYGNSFSAMNGFGVGNDATRQLNGSSTSQLAYAFKRAPGFFDEVCYTGTGAVINQAHNLAAPPELVIFKSRSAATAWRVIANIGTSAYDRLQLNATTAAASDGYGSAKELVSQPTSTTLSIGTGSTLINSSGVTFVAYLFASCPGVSKVGSYTGNGTTQAIACGFTGGARFVLIKRTDSTGDWYVYDTARGMTVLTDPYLLANSTAAETATLGSVITSTGGFTVNAAILAAINTNAATYIFLAIA